MKFKIISLVLVAIFSSCATQEEIDRRELLKKLNTEMQGQQKIVKGLLLATQRIERSLGTVSGKIEENEYQEREHSGLRTLRDARRRSTSLWKRS